MAVSFPSDQNDPVHSLTILITIFHQTQGFGQKVVKIKIRDFFVCCNIVYTILTAFPACETGKDYIGTCLHMAT